MYNSAISWNEELDCPVVYVAGTCITSADESPLASYGIYWGFKDPKNKSGPVKKEPNQLRAELSGLVKTLQIAVAEKIPKLIIKMNSKKMNEELEMWEQADKQDKLENKNSDILMEMDQLKFLARQYMYWMADVAPYPDLQAKGYKYALNFATINATKFPWKVPQQAITVAIHGACAHEGQQNPKASYGVFWGDGDPRNDQGLVEGKQTHLRAEFRALQASLETAVEEKVKNLCILTRNVALKNAFNDIGNSKNIDQIVAECKKLSEKLNSVRVKHILSPLQNDMLDAAKEMAKSQQEAVDCNANVEYFSKTMEEIDDMILEVDEFTRNDPASRSFRKTEDRGIRITISNRNESEWDDSKKEKKSVEYQNGRFSAFA